jgi:hypothetical protein
MGSTRRTNGNELRCIAAGLHTKHINSKVKLRTGREWTIGEGRWVPERIVSPGVVFAGARIHRGVLHHGGLISGYTKQVQPLSPPQVQTHQPPVVCALGTSESGFGSSVYQS